MRQPIATPRMAPSVLRIAVAVILVIASVACTHVDGVRAARRVSSTDWLARVTTPGNEMAALASLSWSDTAAPSEGGRWDFHGRPFSTRDGVSVYETYTLVDAAGKPYRSYAKLSGGPCIDARKLARRIDASLHFPGHPHPDAGLPEPVYLRDSGSVLLFLHASRGNHCLVEVSARRKG